MEIRRLRPDDIHPDMLTDFDRYQEVTKCWRLRDGEWQLQDVTYVSRWDEEKKASVVASISWCLGNGGHAHAAYLNDAIIGFAAVDSDRFGSHNQYVNMGMLHVSHEHRNQGIGKRLFAAICESALDLGAEKLYISAHSAAESIAFYFRLGCVDSAEINKLLAEHEPFDRQMEYVL